MLKRILILILLAVNYMLDADERVLPIPYTYLEDVCFSSEEMTFCPLDKPVYFQPLEEGLGRGYRFLGTPLSERVEIGSRLLGTTLFLCEHPNTRNFFCHYFHLLEHIVGVWAFYGDAYAEDVKRIVLASDGPEEPPTAWQGPNGLNEHLLKALFPKAVVQTWEEFRAECGKSACMERCIFSDRALSMRDPRCCKINKMLGAALPNLSATALERMGERVREHAGAVRQRGEQINVTYIRRSFPRALMPHLEVSLLEQIGQIEGVSLQSVDLATISFEEQVQIISNTDLLVGVHGNGLSHLLFLPEGAAVVELFPPDFHALDYRLFSEARGLDYFGLISKRGVIDRETAYEIGAFGYSNAAVTDLDERSVLSFIDSWVASRSPAFEQELLIATLPR